MMRKYNKCNAIKPAFFQQNHLFQRITILSFIDSLIIITKIDTSNYYAFAAGVLLYR